jgi:hypothetical protein
MHAKVVDLFVFKRCRAKDSAKRRHSHSQSDSECQARKMRKISRKFQNEEGKSKTVRSMDNKGLDENKLYCEMGCSLSQRHISNAVALLNFSILSSHERVTE